MNRFSLCAAGLFVCGVLTCGTAVAHQHQPAKCSSTDLDHARHVFHRTWFEEADGLFGAYLANCPDDAVAHAYVAVVDMLLYRDNAERIELALRSGATLDEADSLLVSAITSFAAGKLEDAERDFRRFVALEPADSYASHFLGFTLNDLGRHDEGVSVLLALLQDDPDYFPAKNHIAYALLELGDSDAAIRVAREFVASDPANPSAWDTQAHILHSLGRSEEAIASLARSVLLDARFAYGFRHLGNVLASIGNDDAAKAAYRKALGAAEQYGPDFVDSVEELLASIDGS